MRPRRARTAACAAVIAVLVTAGCGDDPVAVPRAESAQLIPLDASPPATETPTVTPTPTPTPTATPTETAEPEPEDEPTATEEPEPEESDEPEQTTEPEEPDEPEPTNVGSPDPSQEPDPEGMSKREQEVVDLTNEVRADEGCGPLRADDRLHEAAVAHSEDMAERDYFDHVTPEGVGPGERAERAGYDSWGGENIAWGYQSAEAVVEGWMDSDGHRANILNCDFEAIGVGAANSGRGPYWTQTFGYE